LNYTTRLSRLQASIWERSAVLTDTQQRAIDVISASCSQRPMPKQLATRAQSLPDATPVPATPMSPGSPDANFSSFAGTSFEDVTLQARTDCMLGCSSA
jgi:hypothetical protein